MLHAPALLAGLAGLSLGLGLIVAIGAQNAFVLRQGLRVEHVAAVVLVCTLSDLVLINAGVLGAGEALSKAPWLVPAVCIVGSVFLAGYAGVAGRRAWRPGVLVSDASGGRAGLAGTVATCLALTWLNPHVYLDTVLLLGSTASTFGARRWEFAAGACLGSALWFLGLGYGARLLRPVFARATAWRALDGGIAVVMAVLAVSLAVRGLAGA